MGRAVFKEAPDVDYYVEWSSVVDAPVWGGDRESTLAHLWATDQRKPEYVMEIDPSHPEARLKRCDETGTTTLWEVEGYPREGAWEDGSLIYQQRGTVSRANLFVLTRRLCEDESADVTDLLEPFEDETEVRP